MENSEVCPLCNKAGLLALTASTYSVIKKAGRTLMVQLRFLLCRECAQAQHRDNVEDVKVESVIIFDKNSLGTKVTLKDDLRVYDIEIE